jgi:hypothetical protein
VADWPAVRIGRKTEFRRATKRPPIFPYTPTPVVAYTVRGTTYESELMVLEEVRHETLWQIQEQPESLRRECFDTYVEFRRYWKARTGRYLPLTMVYVYVVRPFGQGPSARVLDKQALGARILEHLYGEFLPDGRS